MVGENAKKPVVFEFSKMVEGLPYCLGKNNLCDGIDCFILIVEYFKYCKVNLPLNEQIDGITFSNYKEKYLKNKNTIDAAVKFLSRYLKVKSDHQAFVGDILLLSYKGDKFFGIDVGNGNALTVNIKAGVSIIKKETYKVLMAWAIR